MKEKNISVISFVCINELQSEQSASAGFHEMAFDAENIIKLVNSSAYQSALYYKALKSVH